MKTLFALALTFGGIACRMAAGPVEDGIVAAMNLSERANYSWVSVVDDDARTYDIVGQTSREGFTRIRMPVVNAVRRRLGRSPTDNAVEAIFYGNVDCVFATEKGWKSIAELPAVAEEAVIRVDGSLDPAAGAAGGTGIPARKTRAAKKDDERDRQAYSNLQLGISRPHEELGVIVGSGENWRAEGESVSGTLTALGAQLLLVRDGQPEITPEEGAGSFTLWFRDGLVYRYQVKLTGVLAIETGDGKRRVNINQSTTTLIQAVGSTSVEVPAEVRQRFVPPAP